MSCFRAHEKLAYDSGAKHVAGVDEAGRGPLAGPVVAAACFIPLDVEIPGVNDSKKLTPKARDRLYKAITEHPQIEWAVSVVEPEVIDEINILQATFVAMRESLNKLKRVPDVALIDGADLVVQGIKTEKIIKGDSKSAPIAAASILAKVTRDRIMCDLHDKWPEYGFHRHKGYGTKVHMRALEEFGPTPIHRRSFAPVANACAQRGES